MRCLFVLGMHRSGTSCLANAIGSLGAEFGGNLIGPKPSNKKGHFEDVEVVRFNDAILRFFGARWKTSFRLPPSWKQYAWIQRKCEGMRIYLSRSLGESALWCIKDPRLCRLVPVWRHVLRGLGRSCEFLLAVRAPKEVAASLARRDGIDRRTARALWLEHLSCAEADTRDSRRHIVAYEDLLQAPEKEIAQLQKFVGLQQPSAGVTSEAVEVLDASLRSHHPPVEGPPSGILEHIYDAARNRDEAGLRIMVDDVLAQDAFVRRSTKRAMTIGGWGEIRTPGAG